MYTKNELENIVINCSSYSEVLRILGKSVTGSSHKCLKDAIIRFEINVDHFKTLKIKRSNKKLKWQDILNNNQTPTNRTHSYKLRRALIESGIEYKCNKCGIKEWCGDEITLEVDHIDGDWKNNNRDNLRFLCPNCHSLTSNFYHTKNKYFCICGSIKIKSSKICSKCNLSKDRPNSRKVSRPTKEYLEKAVWEKPTCQIAKDFGVSDTAIKKWCKRYKIDKPGRGYWQKQTSMATRNNRVTG